MIATFHVICILARYVYVVLSESLLAGFRRNVIKEVDHLSCKGGKYQIQGQCFFEEHGPKFFPQLYVQRYQSVKEVLEDENWKGRLRKVVEFGCADFGFFPFLKNLTGVHEILEVDVDPEVLVNHYSRVSPLNTDYLCPRPEPLTVFVFEGNIAHTDECLIGCDAVVCIELIEHLYPDVLEEVPYSIFGVIKPQVAIFTTPNGEFNVLFPNSKGFRHPDHKFEWTREQFKNWARNIVIRYPDYKVSFYGIGWGPSGTENVGTCSQMAVFERHFLQLLDNGTNSPKRDIIKDDRIESINQRYNLLRKNEYPFHKDTRSEREKFCEQAEYSVRVIASSNEFMDERNGYIEIPLFRLLPFVSEWTKSIKDIEDVLKEAGWELVTQETGCIAVLYQIDDSTSSWSEDPVECDNYVVPHQEDEELEKVYDWNDFENESGEKWDCDSSDLNVEMPSENQDNLFEKPSVSTMSELPEKPYYIENKDHSDPSTSGFIPTCVVGANKNSSVCFSNLPVDDRQEFFEKLTSDHEISDVQKDGSILNLRNADVQNSKASANKDLCSSLHSDSNYLNYKLEDTSKLEISEGCDSENCNCDVNASSSSSVVQMNGTAELHSVSLDLSIRAANCETSEVHHSEVHVPFPKSNSSNNLYLNLQSEAPVVIKETIKKPEGLYESPVAGSVSLEEPNDRLADSGYPNSTSAQDMDLDLTPEQVDELFTENDVVPDHQPDHHCDSASVSSRDSDSPSEARPPPEPLPVPVILPQHDVLFEEAMNVENGDVANNNRDGEGNNVVAIGALRNDDVANGGDDNVVGIVLPENFDDLIPLFAAAEDLDNDNEIEINVVEPFPPWLLNLLGLANGGAGGGIVRGEGDGENVHHHESSDEEDSDRNAVIDEGLGDEDNLDSSSLSDTCPSDAGLESDIGGEAAAAVL